MHSVVMLGLVVGFAADEKKPLPPIAVVKLDRKTPVAYEKDIEPILVNKCQYCHTGNKKEARLDLASYDSLMRGGKSGPAIVPNKSAESRLVKQAGRTEKPFMPPKNDEPLTPEELALIKLWIDQGAKAPTGMREKPKIVISAPPAMVKPVRGVVISRDKKIVVASRGNEIHIYDAATGDYVRSLIDPKLTSIDNKPLKAAHLSLVEALAISPDGTTIASGAYQEVVLWDAQKGEVRHRIGGFAERVVTLDFSPDGKLLATGGGAPTEDGEVKLLATDTGKLALEIKNSHSDQVFGVRFRPDGKVLATCGADKFVKTWELPDGKFLKSFEGHTHHVLDVDWKGDGKILVSAGADNVVKVWDFEKGEQAKSINAHSKQVTRLQFIGATDQFVTCSGDTQVRIWTTNGNQVRTFGGGSDFLYALSVSTDGKLIAAGGEDGLVRLYNGSTGAIIKVLTPADVEVPKK